MNRGPDIFNRNNRLRFIGLREAGCVYPVNNGRKLCITHQAAFLFWILDEENWF